MEVIIVDDNSPDGTQDKVKGLQSIYGEDKIVLAARAGKLGLGSAYIHGLERCKNDYIVLMDADLSHHVRFNFHFLLFYSLNSFLNSLTKWSKLNAIQLLEQDIYLEVEYMDGT